MVDKSVHMDHILHRKHSRILQGIHSDSTHTHTHTHTNTNTHTHTHTHTLSLSLSLSLSLLFFYILSFPSFSHIVVSKNGKSDESVDEVPSYV